MALTKVSNSMVSSAPISVLDYGADNTGATDSTAAIQAAINAGVTNKSIVYFPAGTYLVSGSLDITNGAQLQGETGYQLPASFGVAAKATTINFAPASQKSLFVATGTSYSNFRLHYSMTGLAIVGNSTDASGNSDIGLDLQGVIYGAFTNMSIVGFRTAINCNKTINNRFENLWLQGEIQCVSYAGSNETTDVWEQCSFQQSPVGVAFAGSTIGVRFSNCLLEQIDNYGFDIAKECQNIIVSNAYVEDVPFTTAQADAAVFRVGVTGSTLAVANHLSVSGGMFNGRNAGLWGSFAYIDYCNSVQFDSFSVNRYVNVITTDATNTRDFSVVLGGYAGISWTNNLVGTNKFVGYYGSSVINSGSSSQRAVYSYATIRESVTAGNSTSGGGYILGNGSITWSSGFGSPESAVTAPIGSIYSRRDGGAGTSFYVKESGTGNTGWVAK